MAAVIYGGQVNLFLLVKNICIADIFSSYIPSINSTRILPPLMSISFIKPPFAGYKVLRCALDDVNIAAGQV